MQEHLRATLLQNRSQWLVSRLLLFHGNPKKDNNNNNNNNNKTSDITIINKKPITNLKTIANSLRKVFASNIFD